MDSKEPAILWLLEKMWQVAFCRATHYLAIGIGYAMLALLLLAFVSISLDKLGIETVGAGWGKPPSRLYTDEECHTLVVR